MLPADVFAGLTQSLCVGHHNVGYVLLVAIRAHVGVVLCSPVLLGSNVCPIQSPCWVLAIIQCFIQVIFFLLQQLLIGTDCPSPMFKGINNTIFGRQMVVTVPCKYKSVCVGFLHTVVNREVSG